MIACLAVAVSAGIHDAGAAECRVEAGRVNFGKIDALRPETMQAVGTLVVTCDEAMAWAQVRFSSGVSGQVAQRELRSDGHRLRYNLYSDIGQRRILGDGSPGASGLDISPLVAGQAHQVSVFAVIDPGQTLKVGTYTDQIMVSIDF